MRINKSLSLIAVALTLAGCITYKAPMYSPNYEVLDRLKKLDIQKLSVGKVQPTDINAVVNKITLRGSPLASADATFSMYFENAIRADLQEIGVYDANSTAQINATLLKNDINISGIVTGTGEMEVKLSVTKNNIVSFEKNFYAKTEFESSFVGAVAIPKGQSEYPILVKALLQKIYTDTTFLEAIKK